MDITVIYYYQAWASIFIAFVAAQSGPLCYNCDRLPKQRDCNTIVQCGPNERCYGEHYVTSGAVQMFRSGCKDTAHCSRKKKKSESTLCTSCCTRDYCNIQLCDRPIQLGKRCLACDDVIDPRMCTRDIQCDADQMCYAEEIYNVNKEKRYRLGCAPKLSCGYFGAPQIGRRHVTGSSHSRATTSYCGQCCDTGKNCNRDLCRTGAVGYDLLMPPPLQNCFDYDSSYCAGLIASDPLACNERTVRYLMCPRSCSVCSGAGGIPGNQATTAVQPKTTATPSGQCPPKFELQRCQVIDCAIGLCADPILRPLCPEYCSGLCIAVDCSNTKFANT
ncbi:uncharacterized protein LOC110453858 [Mizuhopecten yessoensis]|uniref:ShKT domain-containing protein n=1 Tax=Mizuhopecten yessoensis TaxID=6573 RepID=A0A210QGL9_MIZYE|nr:uncharacterized protein LOC110453858 [Mizuhopecten yessoensis]OWF47849.1 hypothetical protein KP79_PYT22838 [Mizuhopecten yessoensis]